MKRFRQTFITVVILLLLFSTIAYGDTWTTNKNLSNNAGYSSGPAIAADGSNLYVVWTDGTYGPSYEIYFKKSVDGGATWTKNKRLTNNAGDSYAPAIAVDGQNIYVVWQDDTPSPGAPEIYFNKSVDGGDNWTTDKRLTNNAGESYDPAIVVGGSIIYVVWGENPEIYFKKSVDGGTTWTTKNLSNNAGDSYAPAIAVDGSSIYVVWTDWTPVNPEIYFKKSVDGGATWTKNKRLTYTGGRSYAPSIAVDGSNIYVVWYDGFWYYDPPENYQIYFKKSVNGGATWTTDKRLTKTAGGCQDPAIAVDGSNIYVVWQNNTPPNYDIYFKKGILF